MAPRLKKFLQVTGAYLTADLTRVFVGFVAVGWLLSIQRISLISWFGFHVVLAYLAWAGTGAVALSLPCITTIMWMVTLSRATLIDTLDALPIATTLNPAQIWAFALMLSWLLAMIFSFKLAHLVQSLSAAIESKISRFLLICLIVFSGLHLGRLIEVKTNLGQ